MTTRGCKNFYTNIFGYLEQYVTHTEKKVPHLLPLANTNMVVWFRDCWSAKMLLSTVTVGQVHAVLCSKLSLSTA